jgi:hypothetical protein
MRCKECGRTLKRVKSSTATLLLWKWGVWAVVLIVGISSATAVVIYSQKRSTAAERQAKSITAKFETLIEHLQPLKTKGFKPEVREEVWEKDFNRKIVHWEGVIDEVDPMNKTIKIVMTPNAKKPDVIVTFIDPEDLSSVSTLKPGEKIGYSARLVGYGENGFAFTLADGVLDK